jgi:HK97 family phage portal protein
MKKPGRLRTVATRVSRAASALASRFRIPRGLSGINGDRGGWLTLFDSGRHPGDFQSDIENPGVDRLLRSNPVFACATLIASDIAKLGLRLVEQKGNIWAPTFSAAFSPVLRRPNRFQTRQKFIEQWMLSKLIFGNTYILKERDQRGVVIRLYVLDPQRVTPLVAPDGAVYYQLQDDMLAGIDSTLPAVPASEIIHDTMYCLFHPLVGISPLFACALTASQGLKIQKNSALFFENMSRPSGILTAPGEIGDETAKRIKDNWEKNYTRGNIGKVAVLGDDLKYSPMHQTAEASQMTEQLKMSAEMVCAAFHVPPFKAGFGTIPQGLKVEDMNQIYYSDCLQSLMESIEALLDEGLGLVDVKDGTQYGTEFNLDDLLKMDSVSMITALDLAVKGGWMKPNEAREKRNLAPTEGGDTPYMQQQNFALAALKRRDDSADPFKTASPPPAPAPTAEPAPPPPSGDAAAKALADALIQKFMAAAHALT